MYPILYNFFAMFFILYKNVSFSDHKKRKISFQFQHKLQKYLSFRNICYSFIYSAKIHHNLKAETNFKFYNITKISWIFINKNKIINYFLKDYQTPIFIPSQQGVSLLLQALYMLQINLLQPLILRLVVM